jgi:hypothetical protein
MFRRRGAATWAIYAREELLGFVGREVDYEIHATVTRTEAIEYFHIQEAYEVEVITVVRIDPDTCKRVWLDPSDWTFTDEEYDLITNLLASTVEDEGPDDPDPAEDE